MAATRQRVGTRHGRFSWPVTGPTRRTTHTRRSPWPRPRWPAWPRPVWNAPRMRQARSQPSRRLWRRAMPVRQPPTPWRMAGVLPPEPRGARRIIPRRPGRATRPPWPRSGWPRPCGGRTGRHETPPARASWHRCWVRAKQRGGAVAAGCGVWRSAGAPGVGSACRLLGSRGGGRGGLPGQPKAVGPSLGTCHASLEDGGLMRHGPVRSQAVVKEGSHRGHARQHVAKKATALHSRTAS